MRDPIDSSDYFHPEYDPYYNVPRYGDIQGPYRRPMRRSDGTEYVPICYPNGPRPNPGYRGY